MWRHFVLGVALTTSAASVAGAGMTFTENQGQWDAGVKFRAAVGGATIWFAENGIRYQFVRSLPEIGGRTVSVTLVGANPCPRVAGENAVSHKSHYFLGNDPAGWRRGVSSYEAIVFEDIYDGIDLKYYSEGSQLEYDLVVWPGADVARIEIAYDGIESLSIRESGELSAETTWGTLTELAPVVYQVVGERCVRVGCAFRRVSERSFGFALGADYDPAFPVVIDPALLFATYLGGGAVDEAYAIAVDGDENIYVTGRTYSANFPTASATQGFAGIYDVFVTKFDRWGGLVYSTYIGGGGGDTGYGIAVDDDGCAYVTGATASVYFPTKNPYKDGPLTCDGDAFVTKLGAAGDSLVFSTYLGGADVDWGRAIAVDDLGYVYVGGQTQSSDYPALNAYQTFQGIRDACVTKFYPAGSSLVYSTCVGGSGIENTWDMALGADGSVYVTGETQSADYPTVNAYQTDRPNQDVFLSKLHVTGDSLVYSTYLGGNLMDVGTGVAVDGVGCAYVTGWTQSTDFPLVNNYQWNMNFDDVFVTKFNATGDNVVYSTYLGGNSYEIAWAIEVDAAGHAYVAGWTRSTDFPTQDPYQTHQDTTDAFLAKLNATGNGLDFGTYLGGSGADEAWALALGAAGNAYVAGRTQSTDFPTYNPYQSHQGTTDAFVARVSEVSTAVDDGPVPAGYALYQNVPNPFNPTTTIRYEVPRQGSRVRIAVYNVEGQLVRALVDGFQPAGERWVSWDGTNTAGRRVASGVYFYRFTAPGYEQTLRMLLLE